MMAMMVDACIRSQRVRDCTVIDVPSSFVPLSFCTVIYYTQSINQKGLLYMWVYQVDPYVLFSHMVRDVRSGGMPLHVMVAADANQPLPTGLVHPTICIYLHVLIAA